jgi:hypothetical protein
MNKNRLFALIAELGLFMFIFVVKVIGEGNGACS